MSDIVERARHEIAEDRRIANLLSTARGRATLLQRAAVTEELVAEVERLRRGCAKCERGDHKSCTGYDGPITTHPDSLPLCSCPPQVHRAPDTAEVSL